MYLINNNEGTLELVNPCFPSYAIREVYRHDGFDYLILAEDSLASLVIDGVLSDTGLKNSRLIHISPVGGWQNVLNLHMDLLRNNVIGVNKKLLAFWMVMSYKTLLKSQTIKISQNFSCQYKALKNSF